MKQNEFSIEKFALSLENANRAIIGLKKAEPNCRFRIETCVNKETVTVYVIRKSKITRVITINGTDITNKSK